MNPRNHDAPFGKAYEQLVADAFRGRGWAVQREHAVDGKHRVDLLAERGGKRYAIEVKAARDARSDMLRALLADSILQARSYASALDAIPLAVIAAPYISDSMSEALRQYVEAVAPGQPYGYVDGRGRIRFFGEGLDGEWRLPSEASAREPGEIGSWDSAPSLGPPGAAAEPLL